MSDIDIKVKKEKTSPFYYRDRSVEDRRHSPSQEKRIRETQHNEKRVHSHAHHTEPSSPYKKYHRDRDRSKSPRRRDRHDLPSEDKRSHGDDKRRSVSPKRKRRDSHRR